MGILRRIGVMAIGVVAIFFTLFVAIIVLTFCVTKEWFLRLFPGLYEKYTAQDYVRDEDHD